VDPLDPRTGPDQCAVDKEQTDRVREALETLDRLSPELQEMIHCHVFLDMSFREIEETIGVRRATANDRYQKAIRELERLLANATGTHTP
jgi:RNA polymerase sigma factor (sigma-70 family)